MLALASVPLMRGHANLPNNNPDPEQPVNGGNNNQQEAPSYYVSLGSMPSNWLPVADTTFNFIASTDASYSDGKIVFHLSDVTSYEGWYMNDPSRNGTIGGKPHGGPDIRFAPAGEQDMYAHDGQGNRLGKLKKWTVETVTNDDGSVSYTAIAEWETRPIKSPTPFSITVKLECWDYAAYGVIQAYLQKQKLGGLSWSTTASSGSRTIPLDELPLFGGNKIADSWERINGAMYGYIDTSQDCDSGGEKIDPNTQNAVKHGQNNGDGFSVHEEYRGFWIQSEGGHTRLDPRKKELFIYSSIDGNIADCAHHNDLGYIGSLNQEEIHPYVILPTTETRRGVVNFSRGNVPENGEQRFITVQTGNNPPNRVDDDGNPYQPYGEATGILHSGENGICVIYHTAIEAHFDGKNAKAVFDATIAHEVGHSIGLADHHGTDHYAYVGLPGAPPSGEACVMIAGGFTEAMLLAWQGSGFADFHDDTVHPNHGSWEDHWGMYKLHNNPGGHCSYSKGSSWWQNL